MPINIDTASIFEKKAGRVATTEELNSIATKVATFENDALAVSEIEKFASQVGSAGDFTFDPESMSLVEKKAEEATETITDNTDDIRDNQKALQANADEVKAEIDSFEITTSPEVTEFLEGGDFLDVPENQEAFTNLKEIEASFGVLSETDKADIEKLAQEAGVPFDVLIKQAKEEKRKGFARAQIRGGEAGGFLSTQFAGLDAIFPAADRNDFAGPGGQLESIKSVFDLNIQFLEDKKISAINAAREAARTAKRTGKQADFDNAFRIFDVAKQMHKDAQNLAREKIDVLAEVRKNHADAIKSDLEIIAALRELPEGETFTAPDGTQYTGLGTAPDPFFSSAEVISLMKTLPSGESRELVDPITGDTMIIQGFGDPSSGNKTWKSTNKNTGTEFFVTTDADGNIINRAVSEGTGERFKAGGGGGADIVKLSTAGKNKLLVAFTSADIPLIEAAVNAEGVTSVLANPKLSEEEKNAIRSAYGVDIPEPGKGVDIDKQLDNLGWPNKAIRRFKQEQEASRSSLDPAVFRADNPELFTESGEDKKKTPFDVDED